MDITYSILTSLLVVFFIYVFTYKGRKPRLTMEIKFGSSGSQPRHVVEYTKEKEEDDFYDFRKAIRIYRLEWDVKLIIRNAGEMEAHSTELFFHDNSQILQFQPPLNKLVPISKSSDLTLKCKYLLSERKAPDQRSTASKVTGQVFGDLQLMLKYNDKFGVVNYTKYDFKTKKNSHQLLFRFRKFRSKNLGQIPEGFLP